MICSIICNMLLVIPITGPDGILFVFTDSLASVAIFTFPPPFTSPEYSFVAMGIDPAK